ncbi:MAG: DUF1697 domain-containing protein [Actinobacteria bacterium]|nr:DUF1697 domain-containing protein [Actinomycetota bacterium]
MPSYAVLLKGVNVGGKKKVSMTDLRELLANLGFTNVKTLLQSGNAVVTTTETDQRDVVRQIERGITDRLGMDVRCLTRSGPELRAVIAANPLREIATNGSRMMALFLSAAPDPAALAANDPTTLAPDTIRVGDRVVYHWCPDGVLEAPNVSAFLEKHLALVVTGRNWNTVEKLSAALQT